MVKIKEKKLHALLAGRPNCGKTSLFNALTGMDMRVGNFPGVTVEKKTGRVKGTDSLYLTDLPGTYSLEACSEDEKAAVDYLKSGEGDVIISVCDGTNLERGLALTLALAALGKPVVAAVTFMDEVKIRGGRIDFNLLSSAVGIAVIPVSALTGEGLDKLTEAAVSAASRKSETALKAPKLEKTSEIIKKTYKPPAFDLKTKKLDKLLAGRRTAVPVFIFFMVLGFYLIFGVAGPFFTGLTESAAKSAAGGADYLLTSANVPHMLRGFITEGLIGGVGTVLSFLPVIALLFLFLSVLEDTGYMARIAYIADRVFSAAGLSGRAAVPLLIGFGCTVPAVMACRTLGGEKERRSVARLLPFMSCPAKIPVYSLLCQKFFPGKNRTALAVIVIYLSGIVLACVCAAVMKLFDKSKPPLFVMELPPYRFPTAKNTIRLMSGKCADFIKRAFTVILLASAAVWFLRSYNFSLAPVAGGESMLCSAGKFIAPLFAPLGFGSWQAAAAVITGLAAKEAAASTLTLVAGDGVSQIFTPLSAASFMAFTLLYTPCAATLACMKKETGSVLFALSVAIFQFSVAWLAAFSVYCLGRLL